MSTPTVTLLTGGARSGKSSHALALALDLAPPRAFVATAEGFDDEMRARIAAHRQERGEGWLTVEEPRDLAGALRGLTGRAGVAVVDCLTVWISNLLHHPAPGDEAGTGVPDEAARSAMDELLRLLDAPPFHLVLVTNELGQGIVPMNPLARRFRDLAGRFNQQVARRAHTVQLLVCGQPLVIKG